MRLPRWSAITRRAPVREPARLAQSHPRRNGIGQWHAAAWSGGGVTRGPRALPPAVLRVRIWPLGWRALTGKNHGQKRHQQDDHEVQQSGRVDSPKMRPIWHQQEVSARAKWCNSGLDRRSSATSNTPSQAATSAVNRNRKVRRFQGLKSAPPAACPSDTRATAAMNRSAAAGASASWAAPPRGCRRFGPRGFRAPRSAPQSHRRAR